MPAAKPPAPDDPATMATYWFAKLAAALDRADYILATEAQRQLSRLGWSVAHHRPKATRQGGAR